MSKKCVKVVRLLTILSVLTDMVVAAPRVPDMGKLENQVWLASDEDLFAVEQQTVRLVQTDPKSIEGLYLYAKVQLRYYNLQPLAVNSLQLVNQLAQQIIALDPIREEGYLLQAELMDATGASEDGVRILESAYKNAKVTESWRGYLQLARMMSTDSDKAKIKKLFDQALQQKNSEHDVVIPYLVSYLQSSFEGTEQKAMLDAYEKLYQHQQLQMAQAYYCLSHMEIAAADALYAKILSADATNVEAAINSSVIALKYHRDYEKVQRLLNAVDKMHPRLEMEVAHTLNLQLGEAYLHSKNFKLAHISFLKALKASFDIDRTMDAIVENYRGNNAIKELVAFVEEANIERPGNAGFYAMLAEINGASYGNYDASITNYKNAILLDPEQSQYYTGIGIAYYHLKNFEHSLQAFKTALKVDPNSSLANYNAACLLAKLGRSGEAMESLTKALNIDPTLRELAIKDADLTSLHSENQFVSLTKTPVDEQAEGTLAH